MAHLPEENFDAGSEIDDQKFQQLILQCLETKTERELADELRVSRPTITRWAKGKNLPHQVVRNHFVQYMEME